MTPKRNSMVPAIIIGLLGLLSASVTQAQRQQLTKEHLDEVGKKLQSALSVFNKMTPEHQKALSGGAQNFLHIVKEWPTIQRKALADQNLRESNRPSLPTITPVGRNAALTPAGFEPQQKTITVRDFSGTGQLASLASAQLAAADVPITLAPVQVSTPNDFAYGPSGGFTQSETSTAWCGTHVVVGYNDSRSFLESFFATGPNNQSFDGFSLSTTTGTTAYADKGYLPSMTANPVNFLEGDPVVACANASTFYYSSLFFTVTAANAPLTAISISKSTNGGASFGSPTIVASASAFTHFYDKDWMAVNPMNPNQIAVSFTDFDFSGDLCPGDSSTNILVFASNDAGNTWTFQGGAFVCGASRSFLQGSQVAFSPSGAINVASEQIPFSGVLSPASRGIFFFQFAGVNGGFSKFGPFVASPAGVGDGFELQGGFRTFLDLQGMAVDFSPTPTNGNIYIVYHDSTNFIDSFHKVLYGYSDAMLVKSTDGGTTWSSPIQINTNVEPGANSLGTDSFMPGIAVDFTTGEVGVCWYDRRNDPINFKIDRYCGDSFDGGATFTNSRITPGSFSPLHGADDLVNPTYMGDYDSVASDPTKSSTGFIGAFQFVTPAGGKSLAPNANVKAMNFN